MRWLSFVIVVACMAAADVLTIGSMELSSGEPFCCG